MGWSGVRKIQLVAVRVKQMLAIYCVTWTSCITVEDGGVLRKHGRQDKESGRQSECTRYGRYSG